MNFFFGIKSKFLYSQLTIPKFRNSEDSRQEYNLYSAKIKRDKWEICKVNCDSDNNFYFVDSKLIDNDIIFFLAKNNELLEFKKNNYTKLIGLNKFTDTVPDFRGNLLVQNNIGGFSSYQSEYPLSMVSKTGSIVSSLYSLTNPNADKNLLIFKNIYEKPVKIRFKIFFIDIVNKKILFEKYFFTNKTNEIIIDKKFMKPAIHLYTHGYIGIPMFINFKDGHISFEHTHPPHEYVLGINKFKIIKNIKDECNEIINKENC